MLESEPPQSSSFSPVGDAESGQKLLQFLQRRLGLPESLLHRWLRTGQIRLNGRRCKPFERVNTGDLVRLPPFAQKLAATIDMPDPPDDESGLPPLIFADDGIWAFAKPAGLSVQGGPGHAASLASLLKGVYSDHAFIPVPAHRLDNATTGILLVGASFDSLRQLHAWFREGKIHKEYLAWTWKPLPFGDERLVEHYLEGKDQIRAYKEPGKGRKLARAIMKPLLARGDATLVQIRLLTGCKRQIRAQLAALGSPVRGDCRYGARPGSSMLLHAGRLILPTGRILELPPPWTGAWEALPMPPPIFMQDENRGESF